MNEWVTPVAALVVALVGGGGVGMLIKARPEAGQIVVKASEGAVIVQQGVIKTLEDQMKRQEGDLADLQRAYDACKERLRKLEEHVGVES